MEYKKEGNIVAAKLDHRAKFFDEIRRILKNIDSESAMVISGIGMLTDFKLGYYDSETGEYSWQSFDEPMEMVSVKGSIAGQESIHIHAALAGKDHMLRGGHLEGGSVYNVCELTMLVFDQLGLTRKLDPSRDMKLLSIE